MHTKKNNLFILTLALTLSALIACTTPVRSDDFEDAEIHLERNVTDGDAEAVFTIKVEEGGLSSLLIIAPDGRRLTRLESRNKRNLGSREILLESPEPGVDEVLAAYPEGTYRFVGRTFDGEDLTAEADLSHVFPEPANITSPLEGSTVPAASLIIQWEPVEGVEGYLLELEQEELESELTVSLPASATSFSPPAGWLRPGEETVVGIGTLGENGNVTFIEVVFNTAQ